MTERNCERTTPCAKCPYRTDAPLAFWHVDHFTAVLIADGDPVGPMWDCHTKDGGVCVGWALDQRRRDFPNLNLRLAMHFSAALREQLTVGIHDAGLAMYPTVRDMCVANILAIFGISGGARGGSEEIDVPETGLRRGGRRTKHAYPVVTQDPRALRHTN